MKFSEVEAEGWGELAPFVDTCLIPYTGLSGDEMPWEVTAALERLRDLMDLIEIPFKGRVVTYPALQYGGEGASVLLSSICSKASAAGFAYVVVITADHELTQEEVPECSLVLSLPKLQQEAGVKLKSAVSQSISKMWTANLT
ncbi:DUF2487 family protein [Paenibacillus sp. JSM ZJ436]|uniref:DUF2487 family protein n=1 Tax=Paenibacillus sp. JSM ZJ436 TaxID=3376190 RepID=UPI0037985B47